MVEVYYLEMFSRPQREIPCREGVRVVPHPAPAVEDYWNLYDSVGRDYRWTSRRQLTDEQLAAIIHDPLVEIHLLTVEEQRAGFAELDRRIEGEIELVQFGLLPGYIGQGLGKHFLHHVIELAWSYQPQRFWLHTCTNDHAAALPNYLKSGFQLYRTERRV